MATSQSQFYIGRQPILNRESQIKAYELLFRSSEGRNVSDRNDLYATSSVIVTLLNQIGVHNLLANYTGYINVENQFFENHLYENLNPSSFVLELLETCKVDQALIDAVDHLHKKGFRFALDDVVLNDQSYIKSFSPLLPYVSVIKIDVRENTEYQIKSKLNLLQKSTNAKFLAEKIENVEEFHFYRDELQFDLFQGYFFSKPTIIQGQKIEPKRTAIMELLHLIETDADINKLEETFKRYPDITVNLLKFINSSAFGTRSKVTSIRQAIALLGYKKLFNWLMLLAYVYQTDNEIARPLFDLALQRAKMMETLIRHLQGNNPDMMDAAFLTGLLSLVGALYQEPLEQVLSELGIGKEIYDAIISKENLLGKLLFLIETNETNDVEEILALLDEIKLSLDVLNKAAIEGFTWAQLFKGV
ncbi:EAL and HDOD domain-containing protein [Thermospira aquatica]|uniref:HDOD domain-containing protein n=1 Tax=Thermospira aquatica TaxID=2828656 RepID=A0AAX3BDI2_9SPIR|nr:HDOD domain-containing protein [Thermospira aquatica]URA10325.1 HDOD domain-containing protein [Thermospira aquatica]